MNDDGCMYIAAPWQLLLLSVKGHALRGGHILSIVELYVNLCLITSMFCGA